MPTHMIQAPLDMHNFNRWAGRERGLMRRGTFDAGYALHILLSAMFGKGVLQPFRLFSSPRRRNGCLYAYTSADTDGLRSLASTVGGPSCLAILAPSTIRSKSMPTEFSTGQRLGFDLRIRPVRRLYRDLPDSQSNQVFPKGSELDAFRVELIHRLPDGWQTEETAAETAGLKRDAVYRDWLAERLGEAACLERCRLAAFQRTRVFRGDGRCPQGPDVTLHGVLRVGEPEGFAQLITKGVGRHRAFGYGMLLLRPPTSHPQRNQKTGNPVVSQATT